jgi:ribosomal protein L30E
MSVGDLFVLKSQINKLYTYNGTTWDLGVVLPTEEPTENLQDGDQWFDTDENKLYTYNGTTWDLGVVLPTEEPTENLQDGDQWFDKGYIYTLKEYNGNN